MGRAKGKAIERAGGDSRSGEGGGRERSLDSERGLERGRGEKERSKGSGALQWLGRGRADGKTIETQRGSPGRRGSERVRRGLDGRRKEGRQGFCLRSLLPPEILILYLPGFQGVAARESLLLVFWYGGARRDGCRSAVVRGVPGGDPGRLRGPRGRRGAGGGGGGVRDARPEEMGCQERFGGMAAGALKHDEADGRNAEGAWLSRGG